MSKVKKVKPQIQLEEEEVASGPVVEKNGDRYFDSSTRSKWGQDTPSVHDQMKAVRSRVLARNARHGDSEQE